MSANNKNCLLCKQMKIDTNLSLWYNNQGDSMNKQLDLFVTFMKIGTFTFGGGYAMIPLIQREVCDNKQWLNEDDILEVVAIAESTPGPVAINAATFVGSRTAERSVLSVQRWEWCCRHS